MFWENLFHSSFSHCLIHCRPVLPCHTQASLSQCSGTDTSLSDNLTHPLPSEAAWMVKHVVCTQSQTQHGLHSEAQALQHVLCTQSQTQHGQGST